MAFFHVLYPQQWCDKNKPFFFGSFKHNIYFYREVSRSKNGKVVVVVVVVVLLLLLLLVVLSFLRSRLQGKRRDSLSVSYVTGLKGMNRETERGREIQKGSNLVPEMY